MVDRESIDSRLEHLAELLDELERIREGGRGAYDEEFQVRLAARHAIQLAIQICVDIGAHMIAELGVLVHVYLDVDDDKVWEAFGHLDDLRQFAAIARGLADRDDS